MNAIKSVTGSNGNRYNIVVSENYLCVPSVLQIIINSESYYNINKYIIADYFGVVLPRGIMYEGLTNYTYSDDIRALGVTIEKNSINSLFHEYCINLKEEFYSIRLFEREFLSEHISKFLKEGSHIICGYDFSSLHGDDLSLRVNTEDWYAGHVSIIIDADINSDTIVLLDPGPKNPGVKTVNASDLYRASMVAHDGLWIITRT